LITDNNPTTDDNAARFRQLIPAQATLLRGDVARHPTPLALPNGSAFEALSRSKSLMVHKTTQWSIQRKLLNRNGRHRCVLARARQW
jgi:hypothetical protein